MKRKVYYIEIEKYALPCEIRLSLFYRAPKIAFINIDGGGIIVACRKPKHDQITFFVCFIQRIYLYRVGISVFDRLYVLDIDQQPFGYFLIRAFQIILFEHLYRRDLPARFRRDFPEYCFPKPVLVPILPKRRIAVFPTDQFLQVGIRIEIVITVSLLYFPLFVVYLTAVVYIAFEQIRADAPVLYGQPAAVVTLAVRHDMIIQ